MVENAEHVIQFHEYFRIIRNRLWVIFTIFSLSVISGVYVTYEILPKSYSAVSQIQIHSRGELAINGVGPDGTTAPGFDPTSFQAEFEIMQSPDVLLPIINDLGLDKIWAQRLNAGVDKLPPQEALNYMSGVVKPDFKRGTDIIEITASSEVPKEAADIANAVADRYKAMRDAEQGQRTNKGADTLRGQIAEQQKVVDEKRAAMENLRQELGKQGVEINPGGGPPTERLEMDLDARKKDYLAAQDDYNARQIMMQNVINLPDDQFISTLTAMGHSEPDIESLRADAFKMESDLDNLLKDGFDENHPRVQSLRAELDRKKQQITELIAGLRRAMGVDTAIAQKRVDTLKGEVDDLTEKVRKDESSALVPFHEAERQLEEQQNLLDALTIRLKQVEADSGLQESPVKIIKRAEIPESPTLPKKGLDITISVMAGLFVGIVVAFLIEYLDTSVKTMADAEMLLGLPVLTVIPNKGGPMPLVQDSARLLHAEGYRILRAKLDLKVLNGLGPSLSMLSGGPGEGKSTTIYNLAVVCAQAGQSVVLIDCDLRRPTLHNLACVSNDSGLANYLRGEGAATKYIQQTALPKLQILTAGNMPMSDIGALVGDKIRAMLDDLKQRYDLVLVDSPPVLGISDGSIIAREVDYVILVIQHRRYPREISLRAKRAVEEVHGNCVGMVLNCVAIKSDDSYYYYSNYGNYYKKDDADRAKNRKPKGVAKANGKPVAASSRQAEVDSDEF